MIFVVEIYFAQSFLARVWDFLILGPGWDSKDLSLSLHQELICRAIRQYLFTEMISEVLVYTPLQAEEKTLR